MRAPLRVHGLGVGIGVRSPVQCGHRERRGVSGSSRSQDQARVRETPRKAPHSGVILARWAPAVRTRVPAGSRECVLRIRAQKRVATTTGPHLSAEALRVKQFAENYSGILVTVPEPTVRPPLSDSSLRRRIKLPRAEERPLRHAYAEERTGPLSRKTKEGSPLSTASVVRPNRSSA